MKLVLISIVFIMVQACTFQKPVEQEMFKNPVLAGFYPDPSICKVGSDYYMVTSTFSFYPGIPMFHSTDLVRWEQLGHVLNRPEQLNLDGLGISEGIYAPTLRYYNGTFYLVCTVVYGIGNFVVTANNPEGPWSNPIALPYVQGMDPDLFFDDDGKAYISSCCPAPDNNPLYEGHRSIQMLNFDLQSLTTDSIPVLLVNGGSDISKKPVWCEAPHVFKKDSLYYLICAEGGTDFNHSEVVFRSEHVKGPYVSYNGNPILTQRNLDNNRKNPITNSGHADLVQTNKGEWWSVFLACRPYTINYFNTGRETFMAPVRWTDGWPVINPDSAEIQYCYTVPDIDSKCESSIPLNGNFTLKDDFTSVELGHYWYFIRTPRGDKWKLDTLNHALLLNLSPERLTEKVNPAFVGRRQQHLHCEASVELQFTPADTNESAGLVAFQNEEHSFYLAKTIKKGTEAVVLYQALKEGSEIVQKQLAIDTVAAASTIWLKIEADGLVYHFYYATAPDQWIRLLGEADARYLSTRWAGGFVGTALGMHATSNGNPSESTARFNWFNYSGSDQVFCR